jgi:hypothetical protein
MFKTVYYAGEDPDDQQRVSHENSDSAYYVEFHDLDEYIRLGVADVAEDGQPLEETWVSLEFGRCFPHRGDPYWWGGTLSQFKELMKKIDHSGDTHAHQD